MKSTALNLRDSNRDLSTTGSKEIDIHSFTLASTVQIKYYTGWSKIMDIYGCYS